MSIYTGFCTAQAGYASLAAVFSLKRREAQWIKNLGQEQRQETTIGGDLKVGRALFPKSARYSIGDVWDYLVLACLALTSVVKLLHYLENRPKAPMMSAQLCTVFMMCR